MRRARWKRKNVRDELTDGAANSPIRRSGRYALPTKSRAHLPAALYLNLNQCAAASAGMEHNGVQIGHPLLLFPLPLPYPQEGFPKGKAAKRRRGRSKRAAFEEAPRLADAKRLGTGWCDGVQTAVPPLCATRGHGGRVASPMFRVGV